MVPSPLIRCYNGEEIVETLPNLTGGGNGDPSMPNANMLISNLLLYMSAEMKWRKKDREREKRSREQEVKRQKEKKREDMC